MKNPRSILIVLSVFLFLTAIPHLSAQLNRSYERSDKEDDSESSTESKEVTPNYNNPSSEQPVQDPIIIQGLVIREDGSLPPFGTVIERDCGDFAVNEVMVDNNGYFSFKIGDRDRANRLFADAEENYFKNSEKWNENRYEEALTSGRRFRSEEPERLTGCVLVARNAGYHSTFARLGVYQKKGLIDAGTIIMYPISRITGTSVSVTNLKAPKPAHRELEDGKKAFKKKEYEKAEKHFKSAISLYPNYAEAWVELGWLYQTQGRNEPARNAYQKASNIDKLYVNPYVRLAQLAAIEHQWQDAIKYSDKTMSLDPVSFPIVFFFKALAYYNMGELDPAEKNVRQGIKMDLNHQTPKMYLLLANILAKKNNHEESIEAMRQYLRIYPKAPDAEYVRSLIKEYKKIAETADLQGK